MNLENVHACMIQQSCWSKQATTLNFCKPGRASSIIGSHTLSVRRSCDSETCTQQEVVGTTLVIATHDKLTRITCSRAQPAAHCTATFCLKLK